MVCAHASRDKRCGVIGPHLVEVFKKQLKLALSGSENTIVSGSGSGSVRGCSHVGGHKFAGNVLWFGRRSEGSIMGDW